MVHSKSKQPTAESVVSLNKGQRGREGCCMWFRWTVLAFPYSTASAKVKLGYQPPSLFSCYITAIMSAIGWAWLFDQALTSSGATSFKLPTTDICVFQNALRCIFPLVPNGYHEKKRKFFCQILHALGCFFSCDTHQWVSWQKMKRNCQF